jgi:hypothetical protein
VVQAASVVIAGRPADTYFLSRSPGSWRINIKYHHIQLSTAAIATEPTGTLMLTNLGCGYLTTFDGWLQVLVYVAGDGRPVNNINPGENKLAQELSKEKEFTNKNILQFCRLHINLQYINTIDKQIQKDQT